eukprot:5566747-Alexandrium_andersonii.AAC.1
MALRHVARGAIPMSVVNRVYDFLRGTSALFLSQPIALGSPFLRAETQPPRGDIATLLRSELFGELRAAE